MDIVEFTISMTKLEVIHVDMIFFFVYAHHGQMGNYVVRVIATYLIKTNISMNLNLVVSYRVR